MILDGCFMLELLQPFYISHSKYYRNYDQYIRLRLDALMLENQLLMFFLIKLKCILRHKDKPNIEEVKELEKLEEEILDLFDLDYSRKDSETTTCLHVLDLCRKSLLHAHSEHGNASPQFSNQGKGKGKRVSHNVAHLVSTFHDAGIRIMKSESKSLRDITFKRDILNVSIPARIF
ncbi:uncharacterized protein LOC127787259 [Diospyros lotus]|uniref:uncharacterized protein LOC127787259 n=1 Tax=Diospyros lotus TaxID=55363 RepID=UPI00225B0BE4|nr:uncharacterized protein LOC127787259 [Diospyros lotus]